MDVRRGNELCKCGPVPLLQAICSFPDQNHNFGLWGSSNVGRSRTGASAIILQATAAADAGRDDHFLGAGYAYRSLPRGWRGHVGEPRPSLCFVTCRVASLTGSSSKPLRSHFKFTHKQVLAGESSSSVSAHRAMDAVLNGSFRLPVASKTQRSSSTRRQFLPRLRTFCRASCRNDGLCFKSHLRSQRWFG